MCMIGMPVLVELMQEQQGAKHQRHTCMSDILVLIELIPALIEPYSADGLNAISGTSCADGAHAGTAGCQAPGLVYIVMRCLNST